MRRISINELPKHSPWPERVIDGRGPASTRGGAGSKTYDDRFGKLLEYKLSHPELGYRDVMAGANHHERESPVPMSQDRNVYLAEIDTVQRLQDEVLVSAFEDVLDGGETVVSLGCGWGYNLGVLADAYHDCTFVGGELSENGVELGRELFGDRQRIRVDQFDFTDPRWKLLEQGSENDVILFTRGSRTALPDAERVITETLANYTTA